MSYDELGHILVEYLCGLDIYGLARVCRSLEMLSKDESLWRRYMCQTEGQRELPEGVNTYRDLYRRLKTWKWDQCAQVPGSLQVDEDGMAVEVTGDTAKGWFCVRGELPIQTHGGVHQFQVLLEYFDPRLPIADDFTPITIGFLGTGHGPDGRIQDTTQLDSSLVKSLGFICSNGHKIQGGKYELYDRRNRWKLSILHDHNRYVTNQDGVVEPVHDSESIYPLSPGTTVTVKLDAETDDKLCHISYSVNGEDLGVAFSIDKGEVLFPAVSLLGNGTRVRLIHSDARRKL